MHNGYIIIIIINKMKKVITISLIMLIILCTTQMSAQVKIGDNPTVIDDGSMLEIESTNKGFVPPRMTTGQMNAIPTPLIGSLVFNTTENCLHQFRGGVWLSFCDLSPEIQSAIGTTALTINQGITSDVPGASITVTVPTGQTRLAMITMTGYVASASGSLNGQGVFELHQNNVKISSGYAFWVSGTTLVRLPASTTVQSVVTLTAGTYTFKVRYSAWAFNGRVNFIPSTYAGYTGDIESMKTRLTVMLVPIL